MYVPILSGFRRGGLEGRSISVHPIVFFFRFSIATYIRELHFLIVVNGCYCYFTLTDKVIVVDVIRQETHCCNEPNTVLRRAGRIPVTWNIQMHNIYSISFLSDL